MSNNIFKIWGERRRILLNDKVEIDLLYLKKDTFCSTHSHTHKENIFTIITGKVAIETEYGTTILTKNESWVVSPPLRHRFCALEDSIMIECASVKVGKIDESDINRLSQGGRIIKGKEYTLDEMRKKGMLGL